MHWWLSKRNIRWYTFHFLPCLRSQLNILYVQLYVLPGRWWIDPSILSCILHFIERSPQTARRAWRIFSIFTRACVGLSHLCRAPVKRPENGRDSSIACTTRRRCDSYMVTRRLHGLTLTRFRTSHTATVDK